MSARNLILLVFALVAAVGTALLARSWIASERAAMSAEAEARAGARGGGDQAESWWRRPNLPAGRFVKAERFPLAGLAGRLGAGILHPARQALAGRAGRRGGARRHRRRRADHGRPPGQARRPRFHGGGARPGHARGVRRGHRHLGDFRFRVSRRPRRPSGDPRDPRRRRRRPQERPGHRNGAARRPRGRHRPARRRPEHDADRGAHRDLRGHAEAGRNHQRGAPPG